MKINLTLKELLKIEFALDEQFIHWGINNHYGLDEDGIKLRRRVKYYVKKLKEKGED